MIIPSLPSYSLSITCTFADLVHQNEEERALESENGGNEDDN